MSVELADGRRRAARRRLMLAVLAYVTAVAAILAAGDRWAADRAAAQADHAAQAAAGSRASLLLSELQKYRLLPLVLGRDPEVRAALASPDGPTVALLDGKLAQLATAIGSAAIYLIDANGRTIAASNAGTPRSFVGRNYGFRPYFTVARSRGAAEFFGLGTVSGQPGLYLSRRVDGPAAAGVIVVKFAFAAVERGWASAAEPAFVTDENGVVLITNRGDWRFKTTRPLPAPRLAELRRTRQFGTASLSPLALSALRSGLVALGDRNGRPERFAEAVLPVPVAGWTLHAFEPVRPLEAALLGTARLASLAVAALLPPLLFLWLRARERADLAAVARVELEERVAERTAELERTQTRFREARELLAHANRLGSLGQITAAVAHEVNQPVAAIRSFADNGAELLRRGDQAGVAENFSTIAALTGRIGAITAELRSFARRGTGEARATPLDHAIEGALLFTGHRLRAAGAVLDRDGDPSLIVWADPLRLEQVLVNLLHNALDAVETVHGRRIRIATTVAGGEVELLLGDTGPGIDPAVADRLFTPFATAKPNGLGLGLGIARDIAREFGGELEVAASEPPWRTAFRLRLRRA